MVRTTRLIALILSVLLIFPLMPVMRVTANPVAITPSPMGGLFSTNNTLQMPEAHVQIVIQPERLNETTFHQNVSIYGNYSIFSPTDINTTIAFAYPTIWDYAFYDVTSHVVEQKLHLFVNGSSTNHETFTFDDLMFNYSLYLESEYNWLEDEGQLTFAAFNASLPANTTLFLEVKGHIESIVRTDVFEFSYCVGTGRTWNGTTHETVQIRVEDYSQYLSVYYMPNSSLSETIEGTTIIGSWDLNLSEFEENYVYVRCEQYSWNPHFTPTIETGETIVILLAGVTISSILIFVIIMKRKF